MGLMLNLLKTATLMALLMALFVYVGGLIGGQLGMTLALLLALAGNFFSYWFSDRWVLKMHKAQPVDAATAPRLVALVQELAARAGLPMPRVYLIDEPSPNAFATGRSPQRAAVAATTGLLRLLDERELRAVMAHELAHVKHRDTLISTVSATLAGAISALAQFATLFGQGGARRNPLVGLLAVLLAPLAASVIRLAISRGREFAADAAGATLSGDPLALARALEKIQAHARGLPLPGAEAHPETAQMMIHNPLSGGWRAWFSTHPSTEARVARLLALAQQGGSTR